MRKRFDEKGEVLGEDLFNKITHEIAAGAMKYALLSCSCHVQINFDIAKV
jgi:arginyl-tRNA synthetase